MKIKIIKSEDLYDLEVMVNKFIDKLEDRYVKDIKVFCSPSVMGNAYVAMLITYPNVVE